MPRSTLRAALAPVRGRRGLPGGPALLFCLLACACAAQTIRGHHLVDSRHRFELELPAAGWQLVQVEEVPVTLRRDGSGAVMAVSRTCGRMIGATAEVLASRLFMQFERGEILEREPIVIGGRPAESILGRAEREGRFFRIRAVVAVTPPCVYDLFYLAPEEEFDTGIADFQALAASFRIAGGGW